MYEIEIWRDGAVALVLPLGARSLHIGRGAGNDVSTTDPSVSWHHAIVWQDGARVFVRDLGSSNGTWLNDERIRGPEELRPTDRVRLGSGAGTELRLRARVGLPGAPVVHPLVVQDLTLGVSTLVTEDRFVIGPAASADVRTEGGPTFTLLVQADGELWLGSDDEDRPLALGEEFGAEGRRFAVNVAAGRPESTVEARQDRYSYRLRAGLGGPMGATAEIEDTHTGRTYRCDGGNRAILLYLLGRRFMEDRQASKTFWEEGWCSDEEIMSGVWGRHGDINKLHVLLHRLRADVREQGLDPWCIEKKQRYVRIRVLDAEVGTVKG